MKIQRFYIDNNFRSYKIMDIIAEYCHIANKSGYANAAIVVPPTLLAEYTGRTAWFADNISMENDKTLARIRDYHPYCLEFPAPNEKDMEMLQQYEDEVIAKDIQYQKWQKQVPHWQTGHRDLETSVKEYASYLAVHSKQQIKQLTSGKDGADESIRLSVRDFTNHLKNKKLDSNSTTFILSKDIKCCQSIESTLTHYKTTQQVQISSDAQTFFRNFLLELEQLEKHMENMQDMQSEKQSIFALKKACEQNQTLAWFRSKNDVRVSGAGYSR